MTGSSHERSRVLIVDDSVDIHRLLKIRLRDQNLDILTASTAAEGMRLASEALPDGPPEEVDRMSARELVL